MNKFYKSVCTPSIFEVRDDGTVWVRNRYGWTKLDNTGAVLGWWKEISAAEAADYGKENVSTETPKQPYGYLPPKLGGEGIGKRQPNDLYFPTGGFEWEESVVAFDFTPSYYYTRPIDPGEGKIILGTNETVTQESEYFNGKEWVSANCCAGLTVKEFITKHPAWTILAIRTRVETPKPVQDEWPKYLTDELGNVGRFPNSSGAFEMWVTAVGLWIAIPANYSHSFNKPITPTQAKAIMRGEPLDNQLAKELADTPYNASPASEVKSKPVASEARFARLANLLRGVADELDKIT